MLHYQRVVSAPERFVVLLHGFLGSGRNLSTLARSWSAADPCLRIALVDLAGHGESSHVPPGQHLEDLADGVLEVAQEFALGNSVDVVGHSLGGRVGMAMARLAPERVRSVTLLDISPGPIEVASEVDRLLGVLLEAPERAESRTVMRAFLEAEGLSRPLADWLLMNMISEGTRGVRWRIDRRALAAGHQRWSPEDLWDTIETPQCRVTRCLRGGKSPFVSEWDRVRLEAAGVEVVTLPEAGHFLHVEDLQGVLEVLRS